MKSQQKTITLWIVVILMMALFAKLLNDSNTPEKKISYSQFLQAVENGQIEEVTLKGSSTIIGKFRSTYENGMKFKLTGNTGEQTFNILRANKITPNYAEEDKPGLFENLLYHWGPMIFLILIFFYFIRQMQGGGGKAMSFGKSKARMLTPNDKKVTFADVAGIEEAKDELREIVDFLKDAKKYTRLGGKIPKGVILVGSPGTGKTLLARAIAGEAGVPFFSISGSDFVEMFVGVGASRVRDLFEQGKKHSPCIIFIDEIDAVGRHRGSGLGGGHDEREQTLNQLLVEMDGFESNEGVILIAATNRIDVLDPALLRPGRFDRRVTVGVPDVRGRLGILKVHTEKTPLGDNVNLEQIAKGTPGFTGADIANLVNEAALQAARSNKDRLETEDFEMAKDKVLMGPERRSMVISEKDKRNTAYHEAGHALVGLNLPETDPIHKVTIIPRGGALGVTQTLPNEDMLNLTATKSHNYIAFLLGGRVAEEITFNEITNGASNDIERATKLAHSMVCHWGFSNTLGPIKYTKSGLTAINSAQEAVDFSEATAQNIDREITKIVKDNYELAKKILTENKAALERIAEGLMLWETLDHSQIMDLVAGKDIGSPIITNKKHSDDSKEQSVEKQFVQDMKEQIATAGGPQINE